MIVSTQNNQKIMAENIQYYLSLKKKTVDDLSKSLNINSATVEEWLDIKSYPDLMQITKMADYFEVERTDLTRLKMNKTKIQYDSPLQQIEYNPIRIPIIKPVVLNAPILNTANISGYYETCMKIDADFCLKVNGDSMARNRIYDGSLVFIKLDDHLDDGKIAAVLVDKKIMIRRIYFGNGGLKLTTDDPEYPDVFYSSKALKNDTAQIIGRVESVLVNIDE